jgi:hypothetical protein
MIEVGPYVKSDDVYPPALGKISDDSTPWSGGHCMMASHGDGNENRDNNSRNRTDSGRQVVTHDQIRFARRVYAGEVNFGPKPSLSDMAALRFVVQEKKDQISTNKRVLERRREEADASSRRQAERSSHYSSSVQHRSRSCTQPGADMYNITRNLEAEFNEAELMPKTKEAAIMAAAAYIAANGSNGDEHMRHLRNLALEGVRVLQGTPGSANNATARRTAPPAEQARHPAPVPAAAPRMQVVEPLNGELWHGLSQNRVDQGRARREARCFEEDREAETFGGANDGPCGAECFSLLIYSAPLPKGIKLSNLIYADTLRKIKIPMNNLLPTETSFHGIVLGKPTYPLGAIHLDVIFGTPANFRKEKIEFEVVDWPSQYHAILGRPAFARFMAVPHYAYLKLRMPANRGPLTISGSFAQSENYDKDFNNMSQTFGVHEELHHIREATVIDIDPPA